MTSPFPSPSPTPPPASFSNPPSLPIQNQSPNPSEYFHPTPRPSSVLNQPIHFPSRNPSLHIPRRSASPAFGSIPARPSSTHSLPLPNRFTSSAPEPSTLALYPDHTLGRHFPDALVGHQEYDDDGEHIIYQEIHRPHELITHREILAPDEHVSHREIFSPHEHITFHQLFTPHHRIRHDHRYIPRGGMTYHEHITREERIIEPQEQRFQFHATHSQFPNGTTSTETHEDEDYVHDFQQLRVLSDRPGSPSERFHLRSQLVNGNYNGQTDQDIEMNEEHHEAETLVPTPGSEHEITPQPRSVPLPSSQERIDRSSPDAPQTPSSGYYSPPIHEHQQSSSPTFQLDTTRAIVGGPSSPIPSDYGHSRSQSLTYSDMYPESPSAPPRPSAPTPGGQHQNPEDQEEEDTPLRLRGGGQEISFFGEEYDKGFPSYSYTEFNQPSRNVPVDLLPDDPPLVLPNFAQKRAEFLAAQAAAALDQQATGGSNTSCNHTIVPNKPVDYNESRPRDSSDQGERSEARPSRKTRDVDLSGIQGDIISDTPRGYAPTERSYTFFGGRTIPILEYKHSNPPPRVENGQQSTHARMINNAVFGKAQFPKVKWYQKAIDAAKASGRRFLNLLGAKNNSGIDDGPDPSALPADMHRRTASETERSNLSASPAETQQLYTHTRVQTPPLSSVSPTSSPESNGDHTVVTSAGNTSEGYHLGNECDHRTRNTSPPLIAMNPREQCHPSVFSAMTDHGPQTPPDPFASGDEDSDGSHRGRKMTPKIRFGDPDSPPISPMETQAYRPEPLTRRSEQIPREPYIPAPALPRARSVSSMAEARISDPALQAIQDERTGTKRSALYQRVKNMLSFNRPTEAPSSSISEIPPTPELGFSSSSDALRARRGFLSRFTRSSDNQGEPSSHVGSAAMSRTSARGPHASLGSGDRRIMGIHCPCFSDSSDQAKDDAERPLLPQPQEEAEFTEDQGKGKGKEVTRSSGDDTEGGGSGSQEHHAENVAGPSRSVGESGGDGGAGSGTGSGREQPQDAESGSENPSNQGISEESRLLGSQPHPISYGMSIPPNIDRFVNDEEDQYPPPNPDMSWVPAPDPSFGPNFSNIYRDSAIANRPFGGIEVGIRPRPRQTSSEASNDPPLNRSLRPPPRLRPSSSSSVRPESTLLPRETEDPPTRNQLASPPDAGSSTEAEVEGFHVPPPNGSTQMVKTDSGASGKTLGKGAQTPGTGHSSQIPPVPDITVRTHDLPTGEDDIDDSPHESLLPPRVLTDPSRNASSTSLPTSVRSSGKSSYRRHSPLRHAADVDPNYNDLLNVENVSRGISQSPSPKPFSEEESQSVKERRRRLKGKWKDDEEAGISMERGIAIPSWSGTPDKGMIPAQELDNPPSFAPSSQQPAVQLPPSLQSVFVPPTPPVQPSPAQTNVSEASSYAIYTRNPEGAYSVINGQSLKEDRSTALVGSKRTSLGEAAISMTRESGSRGHPRSGSTVEAGESLEPPVEEGQAPLADLESLPPLPTAGDETSHNFGELTHEIDDPTQFPPQRIGTLNPTSQASTVPEHSTRHETTKTVEPTTEYSSLCPTEALSELNLQPDPEDSGTSEQKVKDEDTSGADDGAQTSSAVNQGNQPTPIQPVIDTPIDDQPSQPIQSTYPPAPIAGGSTGNPATPFQPTRRSRVKRVWHKIKKTLKKL